MKRLIILLGAALLVLPSTASAQITNSMTKNMHKAAHGTNTVQVCKTAGACDYTVICGADCTDAETACAAGSALNSITDSSVTNPYTLQIGEGIYDECVTFKEKNYLTIRGVSRDSTVIHPSYTFGGSSVKCGIGIGTDFTSSLTTNVMVEDLTVRNDYIGGGALCIGFSAGPGPEEQSSVNDISINNVRAIGHYGGVIVFLSEDGDNAGSVDDINPRVTITNSDFIGGRRAFEYSGWGDVLIENTRMYTKSNYCESTNETKLAEVTGTAQAGGDTNTAILAAGESSTPDRFYMGRKITFASGTCAAGHQGWFTTFTASTQAGDFTPSAAFSIDATCTYTIEAVANAVDPECSDVDWTVLNQVAPPFGGATTFMYGFGHEAKGSLGHGKDGSRLILRDSYIQTEVNDFGSAAGVAAIQLAAASTSEFEGLLRLDNVVAQLDINADIRDATSDDLIGVMVLDDDVQFDDNVYWSGAGILNNRSDADTDTRIINNDTTGAGTQVVVPHLFMDINNTVGSYVGTMTHVMNQGAGTSLLGTITSEVDLVTSGTIGNLNKEYGDNQASGAFLSDVSATMDDEEIGAAMWSQVITHVGCQCIGTCSPTMADFALETRAGVAMTHTTPICASGAADITFQTVTEDAASILGEGQGIRVDVTNTPNPATDEYRLVWKYRRVE